MTQFAEIDENKIVKRILVVEQDFIDTGVLGDPSNWIKVSFEDKRKSPAIGYTYDEENNAFKPYRPQEGYEWDEDDYQWKPFLDEISEELPYDKE
tara:strand:- start:36 stop:320 length:285 start_codon:yes stop_codon:yes gene_type:complete